jgi:coatomer subunit beta'
MQEQRNAVARFLEGREMKREALEIATDPDYRFDLAVSLGELGVALQLAEQSGSELKWRQLGELALSSGKLQARHHRPSLV